MSSPTVNVRVAAARRETRDELERRIRRAMNRLLSNEDFHTYMAHVLYGVLGYGKDDRGSEVARQRRNAAAVILAELVGLDVAASRAIALAHWDALEAELEVSHPNPEDKTDA